MTKRSVAAIIFAIIVLIEVISFVNQPDLTKKVANGRKTGFFAGYDYVNDKDAIQNRNVKYITIIGATILIGGIVTFSLKSKEH